MAKGSRHVVTWAELHDETDLALYTFFIPALIPETATATDGRETYDTVELTRFKLPASP